MLSAALLGLLLTQQAPDPDQETRASWASLEEHATPAWFSEAKFGIFIHWGVYAVPAFCDTSTYSEWYQHWCDTNSHGGKVREFHDRWYGADFEYREFAPLFRAELFDAHEWADIFRRAGARYMVITSKHHDGYCLWPSREASEVRGYPWNSVEVGPGRDLLSELFDACRAQGVRAGLYYSFMEWHNPLFDSDLDAYVERVMMPQIQELVGRYAPDVFWPDGEWNHPDTTWRAQEILAWIYANAPNPDEIVVNDRWGRGLRGQVGDFSTTEYGQLGNSSGAMRSQRPFEECRGIGHSFAFNRAEGYEIYASRSDCVRMLVDLVSQGGNLLLDIGPDHDGRIPLIMVDRLLAMGRWLEINGEAIYGSTRGPLQDLPWGRSTAKGSTLYLHVYDWPADDLLVVPDLVTRVRSVALLGDRQPARQVEVLQSAERPGARISLAGMHPGQHVSVLRVELAGPLELDTALHPDAEGQIHATAARARLAGGALRLETSSDPGGDSLPSLGSWSDDSSTASWELVLEPGRRYRLLLENAVAPEGGGQLEIVLGTETRSVPIAPRTGWDHFAFESCGEWQPGDERVSLTLRASDPGPVALMNLRGLRLVPIE